MLLAIILNAVSVEGYVASIPTLCAQLVAVDLLATVLCAIADLVGVCTLRCLKGDQQTKDRKHLNINQRNIINYILQKYRTRTFVSKVYATPLSVILVGSCL